MRMTEQRQEILNYLKNVKGHPDANEIYKQVRKKLARISLGTVYRNLQVLKEGGLVLELDSAGKSRFDGDVSEHYHFMCNKCWGIFDLMVKLPKSFVESVKKNHKSLEIHKVFVNFYGVCEKCKKKK